MINVIDMRNMDYLDAGYNGMVWVDSQHAYKEVHVNSLDPDYKGVPEEYLFLKFASSVNNLMVKAYGWGEHPHKEANLIIMERLYGVDPKFFSVEQLTAAIEVAEAELVELWDMGWSHGDIKRHFGVNPLEKYNNVLVTRGSDGSPVIRLIDGGTCQVIDFHDLEEVEESILHDKRSWRAYKKWLLGLSRSPS